VSEPAKCLRCQGDLKAGFIPDASYNAIFLTSWVEGTPEIKTGWLVALRGADLVGKVLNFKNLMNRPKHPIVAYRCTACGMLELHAPSSESK
jgi:hypothetical protein